MSEPEVPLQLGLKVGDPAAFGSVYDRYGPGLYRAAWRMLGRQADAEDAVQEVFAAVVRSRHRLGEVEDLGAYLFASLRRAAQRIARQRGREPKPGLASDPPVESPDGQTADAERLWRAVARLPAAQREVLALKIDGELTFMQIGTVLGISPNTAASRYRYALEKLRETLETKR